jgi:phenylacetate-CoA ligase
MLDPPAAQLSRISGFPADTLESYGSYLEALFVHAYRTGGGFRPPRVAAFGSDGLSEPARRLMTDHFGVCVLSRFGAGEAHYMAFECEEHTGLHLNNDLYPVRIADAEGRDVPDGETGEVVISNLVNRATVLLNYRLGDLAAKLAQRCACGRSLPLLSFPEGRADDWLETSSGEAVHAQEVRGLLLADDRWLLGFQVAQRSLSEFAVAVVVDERCDRESFRMGVQERFAGRFGKGTMTEVSFVDSVPRTVGRKVRSLVRQEDHLSSAN